MERYEWEIVSQKYIENRMIYLQASGSWHDRLVIQSDVCVKIPITVHVSVIWEQFSQKVIYFHYS